MSVKDKIIFNPKTRFQLKTNGLIKIKAIPILNINAQPNVRYRVYLLIC